jgi:hypothetical protein
MSEQFTIEKATPKQLLQVLDYVYKSEPSKLKPLVNYIDEEALLSDELLYDILIQAGVENTEFYEDAQWGAERDGDRWYELSKSMKYFYLSTWAVSDWDCYYDIINPVIFEFLKSHSPSEIAANYKSHLHACKTFVDVANKTINKDVEFKEYLTEKCNEYQSKS